MPIELGILYLILPTEKGVCSLLAKKFVACLVTKDWPAGVSKKMIKPTIKPNIIKTV